MMCNVDADSWLDRIHVFPKELPEFFLWIHPADELSDIERAQSPLFKRPASMSTHGEIMEAMYSKRLFNAPKSKSSGILKRQAKPLLE
jgi:hypothetical protein